MGTAHEANTQVSDETSDSQDHDGFEMSAESRKWTARRLHHMEHDPCKQKATHKTIKAYDVPKDSRY